MGGFQGIYKAIATKFVEPDPGLEAFNRLAAEVSREAEARPGTLSGGKPAQMHSDIVALYLACYRVAPRFASFHADMRKRTGAMDGSDVGPLKSIYRAMEKTAFRTDGHQWSANNVLDIVRGSLLFDKLEHFTACLQVGAKGSAVCCCCCCCRNWLLCSSLLLRRRFCECTGSAGVSRRYNCSGQEPISVPYRWRVARLHGQHLLRR